MINPETQGLNDIFGLGHIAMSLFCAKKLDKKHRML